MVFLNNCYISEILLSTVHAQFIMCFINDLFYLLDRKRKENMVQTAEQSSALVTHHWDADLGAVIFELSDVKRVSVDAYIDGNLEVLRTWDKTKTLYTIQDISNKAVSLTPYLKGRLGEITTHINSNQIHVCTAIVMGNDFTGQVMRVFGRLFTINARYLKQVYFTDMASARNWIASQQKKD